MSKKTILILKPFVHPELRSLQSATEEMKAEYALALTQIGANPEALDLFKMLDFKKNPNALLYYSIALFNKWEYGEAIPLLQKYISSPGITDYEILVGKVNLAAAYLVEQKLSEAEKLLQELLQKTVEQDFLLLYGNSLELSVQLAIQKNDYPKAISYLDKANKYLVNAPIKYQIWNEKWRAISELGHNPKSKSAIKKLNEVRGQAIKAGHWQTVRDCDFYQALYTQNDGLFLKVYFGTPQMAYRNRLKRLFKNDFIFPESYCWNPTGEKRTHGHVIDVQMGKDLRSGAILKFGTKPFNLFLALTSDFYVPFTVEALFSQLFPGEFYNPLTASGRVMSSIKSLQAWFDESRIPLEIKRQIGGYRLFFKRPYGIQVYSKYSHGVDVQFITDLKNKIDVSHGFTSNQIIKVMGIPKRTLVRKLNELIEAGIIRKGEASGRSTRYFIVLSSF